MTAARAGVSWESAGVARTTSPAPAAPSRSSLFRSVPARGRGLLLVGFLATVVLFAGAVVRHHDPANFDDPENVVQNPYVLRGRPKRAESA